ncbi:MAG: hypothetical protein QOD99_1855, partial [Chthoniobacter sp.]|nr:hypothetical protein [Chthoniobacter sp.]
LTGTLKHPQQDLQPRLVAAAKETIFKGILHQVTEPQKTVVDLLEHFSD